MNRVGDAFGHGKAFIAYLMAGDPDLPASAEYILTAQKAGADLVEIGIPFSDPIAEGEVIEAASVRALKAGARLDGIFEMVMSIKDRMRVPMVFMTYYNPIFVYGGDRFFTQCAEIGVSGAIIPDMPYEEQDEVKSAAKKHGVEIITLVAPTSKERAAKIAEDAEGFIYLVSSMGVTGVRSEITTDIAPIVREIRKAAKVPVAVGFGISTPEQAAEMSRAADGVIVGSAIVKIVGAYGHAAAPKLFAYIKSMKDAIR